MDKVYTYMQKISKNIAALVVMIGVTSCATSQSTASSGETDGVYYSPSKDGQVTYAQNEISEDYEIKVGGAYFDANGNGAEEFYYETPVSQGNQDINIYTGGNNIFIGSGSTDWGRYDGLEITVNNWGWYDPWIGYGYYSWGWGWGWNWGWSNYYWGYPRWRGWYNPYWGYGPYWGYEPYWGYYNPYYYHGGYYGYHGGHYYRNTAVRPGVRPGTNLALSPRNSNVRMSNIRSNNPGIRSTRNENQNVIPPVRAVRTNQPNVRSEQPVRNNNNNNISTEAPVRQTRPDARNNGNNENPTPRPVRTTRPKEVKSDPPVRNNQIRTNNENKSNKNVNPQRNNPPVRNQGVTPSGSTGNNSGTRSGAGTPVRSSGNTNGGGRGRR